jgi:hypothetical protein
MSGGWAYPGHEPGASWVGAQTQRSAFLVLLFSPDVTALI